MEQLSERVYAAPGGVNIGVVLAPDNAAILIDTGLNDTAVRKVLRRLEAEERRVAAVITTHGHGDHFGGNAFTVRRTGAEVWAPVWDEATLRYPLNLPSALFAGADPPNSLRTKFLLVQPSPVDHVYDAGPLSVAGVELTAISLAGHSPNQMGILVDDVFFCADVVLPAQAIEKYKMPYLYSVRDHLVALDRAEEVESAVVVAGHGPVPTDLTAAIDLNRKVVLDVAKRVKAACETPRDADSILGDVLNQLGANPADAGAYFLLHPTIYAFLTYLEDRGDIQMILEQGRVYWQAT